MVVIRKKWEMVRKALEEAQLKAREEEEVKAQVQREAEEKLLEEAVERARAEAEASRRAQQEQDDAEFQGKSGNEKPNLDTELPAVLSANAHPEEDGDYQPEDVMDVDEGASPKKGKGKAKAVELEERVGAARCGACAGRGSRCWVDPARVKKWKETVACGGGVQGVLEQEAEVLPARVVEGAGGDEALVEEEEGQGGAGQGGQGGQAAVVAKRDEGRWRGRGGR